MHANAEKQQPLSESRRLEGQEQRKGTEDMTGQKLSPERRKENCGGKNNEIPAC